MINMKKTSVNKEDKCEENGANVKKTGWLLRTQDISEENGTNGKKSE